MSDRATSGGAQPLGVSTTVDDVDADRETILLPVGPSDIDRVATLATTAAEVAGMMETTVTILHVFTPERFAETVEALDYDDNPPVDDLVRRVTPVREVARELDDPLEMWGTSMTITGRVGGDVGTEIVAVADALDAKRILVGGRRRTPAGKVVFGSTAQHVLLDANCPVTFVRDT